MRKMWGQHAGQIDTDNIFRVIRCGPKRARLERLDPKSLEKVSWRSSEVRLYDKSEIERLHLAGYPREGLIPTRWDQIFVIIGEDGWDLEVNH